MVTLIITAGRDLQWALPMRLALDWYMPQGLRLLVHGAADGGDTFAHEWAKEQDVTCAPYPCIDRMWKGMGNSAGNVRNLQMLDAHPTAWVAAFPGPKSRGTWNCAKEAVSRGMRVDLWMPGKPVILNWQG
jgi:hypothetical protein